jgi:hypothetical protein
MPSVCTHYECCLPASTRCTQLLPFSLQISTMGSGRVKWLLQSEPLCDPHQGYDTTKTRNVLCSRQQY